ncbi:TetR/AcrR family transcriptional regulator [Dokdonia sp.]|uniref:TetR/AcrR family transcriptional regulator n=1 Tax=Dokdonia sp. TaxID=2024995 RepID=UPI0032657A5C
MPRVEVFDRGHVLEKVKELFWSKGFNGTSMQDLVDVTGLNRSSLYNSFGNKEALFETVFKQYQEDTKSLFKDALKDADSPLDAIHNIFKNILHLILEDVEGKGCFNLNCKTELSHTDTPIKAILKHSEEGTLQLFSGLIKEGQQQALINKNDTPENYAYYLFSAFQGLRMTGMLTRDYKTLKNIIHNTLIILH